MRAPSTLRAALVAAFPQQRLNGTIIDEPTAAWGSYEHNLELALLVGATWIELDPQFIERHATLLIYAGDQTFRALLPGYLLYLIEHPAYNEVPFHVAGQLTRKGNDPAFDRRIAPLSREQRATVREVLAYLATREPMREVMALALTNWDPVAPEATSRTI